MNGFFSSNEDVIKKSLLASQDSYRKQGGKFMQRVKFSIFALVLIITLGFSLSCYAQDEGTKEGTRGRDILFAQKGLPYGFESALPEIHGFLSGQYWNAGEHIQGEYANTGSSAFNSGKSTFLPHSFYIDVISELTPTVFIEGEFEMYHGESFKVGAGRVVWHPSEKFTLSIGRQFVLLGSQEIVYYPTAKYRFMTWQPYVYEKFLRFTGWWDSGIAATGRISVPVGTNAFVEYGLMVSNGPGDYRTASQYKGTMNSGGYVWEQFNGRSRQSYDNNDNKPITWRIGISPIEGLLLRVEGMGGKYDNHDKDDFQYITSELFYSKGKFDGMIGFAQLKFDAPIERETTGKWPGGTVKQMSYYIAGAYKVIENKRGINFLQPVVRYDWFNPNMDSPDSVSQYKDFGKRQAINVGLNYSPWKHV